MSLHTMQSDPLFAQPVPERPAYATGMLLDAQDFTAEQTYHRGRLARALAFLAGGGTLAGLAVVHTPASPNRPEEIRVEPGLAVDRLGRLIEVTRPACLRLERWLAATAASDAGDTLLRAAHTDLADLVSTRLADTATALPARALVADVYLRFAGCAVGLSPSFAAGPFDALNAVSAARIRDAWELLLVAREGLGPTNRGLPLPPADPVLADTGASIAARRDAMQDAVLAGYPDRGTAGGSGGLAPLPEHPAGLDRSAVLIARVFIPIDVTDPPQRSAGAPVVDNHARRFLPPLALLAQWAGFAT